METRTLQFFAEAAGGELIGFPGQAVRRVCTDSRQVASGDLFIALPGERFDGHEFVAGAARRGAVAVVIERSRAAAVAGQLREAGLAEGLPRLLVENVRHALGRLAAAYRRDFTLPMFAVCGSNGKTTTKELVAGVLRARFATLASEASFNNDIGVPLTMLRLEAGHQAAVLEAGTNHPGELAPLLRLIQPRFGLVPSLGREHLEFFGGMEGVLEEEGWLAELLPAHGRLFVNGDNEWMETFLRRCRAPVARVGLGGTNDWRAERIRLDPEGVTFTVTAPRQEWSGEYRVHLLGRHQVVNALLALAAGAEMGLTGDELRGGLAACRPLKMRLQARDLNGIVLLDDTYNANADSTLAGLETLAALPCAGRRFVLLGDMAELGRHAEAAHREAGRRAAELGLQGLWAVGRLAEVTATAARAAGLVDARAFADARAAAGDLQRIARRGDTVLIKASRAAKLEQVIELLGAAAPATH